MPKRIDHLISDIYSFITGENKPSPDLHEICHEFGDRLADKLYAQFTERKRPTLRVSNLGTPCRRRLWYSVNQPELAEPLSGPAKLKFIFGDIIEELILLLARLSGHSVSDEQAEVDIDGVRGHIDAVVDGRLVDVKSASTPNFNKFKAGLTPENDDFGYLGQLGSYAHGRSTDVASFLVVDKTLGNLNLSTHVFPDKDIKAEINEIRDILGRETPPGRHYSDRQYGAGGNRSLEIPCSYCPFKRTCWPGLRRFAYARGPVDFTVVVEEPTRNDGTRIPELFG